MSSNSQKESQHPGSKVKHLYLATENQDGTGIEYLPYYYAEVKIDFNDVRTGFRETFDLSEASEIYSNDADLLWAEDMIRDVDPQKLVSFIPGTIRPGELPDFVDADFISRMETQFIQYLLRSFTARIFRNFALNIYSSSGESKGDFISRCRELCESPKRKELDRLYEVFSRRLEQTRQKYLSGIEPSDLEPSRTESKNRDIFSLYSERIGALVYQRESGSKQSEGPFRPPAGIQDMEEKLLSLEMEAQNTIAKLRESYEEIAQNLDEYILHPNLKDIHFVRSCILWMPEKAS
jgi:hypothetical protein